MSDPARGRTLIPTDFSPEHIETLRATLPASGLTDYRARVLDISWESQRDYASGTQAVEAMCAAATEFWRRPGEEQHAFKRALRAGQLALGLGGQKPQIESVKLLVQRLWDERGDQGGGDIRTLRVLELGRYLRSGPGKDWAERARVFAVDALSRSRFREAQEAFSLGVKFLTEPEDKAERTKLVESLSAAFVAEADVLEKARAQASMIAHRLQSGLTELQRAGTDPERAAAIKKRLLETQTRIPSEMGVVGTEIDPRPFRDEAIAFYSGLPKEHRILRAGLWGIEGSLSALRAEAEEPLGLVELISTVHINSFGHTVAVDPGEMQDPKKAHEFRTVRRWCLHAELTGALSLEAIRPRMLDDARRDERLLSELVEANRHVANGHSGVLLRGIWAALEGDSVVALSVLLPQLEALIRQVMTVQGVDLVKIRGDKLQEFGLLNGMLESLEANEVFGVDLAFVLRSALVDKAGWNLRNEVAHGLREESGFRPSESNYILWLVLRLLACGKLGVSPAKLARKESTAAPTTPATGGEAPGAEKDAASAGGELQ